MSVCSPCRLDYLCVRFVYRVERMSGFEGIIQVGHFRLDQLTWFLQIEQGSESHGLRPKWLCSHGSFSKTRSWQRQLILRVCFVGWAWSRSFVSCDQISLILYHISRWLGSELCPIMELDGYLIAFLGVIESVWCSYDWLYSTVTYYFADYLGISKWSNLCRWVIKRRNNCGYDKTLL
jgi:hypothetical protein